MFRKINFLIIFLFFFLLFFKDSDFVYANQKIIINEIMISSSDSAKHEFIELYNLSDEIINLDGYSLKKKTKSGTESSLLASTKFIGEIYPHDYFLIKHPEYVDLDSDISYSSASYSIAANNTILLYSSDDSLVDKVGYGQATDFEDASTNPPLDDQSLERVDFLDTDDNSSDFIINNNPSPQKSNFEKEENKNQSSPTNNSTQVNSGESEEYKIGDILINEIVSDPSDGQEEWIELFNITDFDVDVSDWMIEEGSGAKTILDGTILARDFFLIKEPKGNLNNKGDLVILRDKEDQIIDKLIYGNWENSDDLKAPVDPYSLARTVDGLNTFSNKEDFSLTKTPTPKAKNIISEINSEEDLSKKDINISGYDYQDTILITEIFPNPIGSDTEEEFFEIYNFGNHDINLKAWQFGDESQKRFIFSQDEDKFIKAKEYLVIFRKESKLAFNNTSDSLKIFQPFREEVLLDINYQNVIENFSYSFCLEKRKWFWSEIITPGEENIIKTKNNIPEIEFIFPNEAYVGEVITFDATDTIDLDDDELKIWWNFGNNTATTSLRRPTRSFLSKGNYVITLNVDDGKEKVQKEKIIKIKNRNEKISSTSLVFASSSFVILSEIFPNPTGNEQEEEWIELYNPTREKINLKNYKISDSNIEKMYVFSDQIIWPQNFLIIKREDSKIALNNNKDEVNFFNSDDYLIEKIFYENAPAGESYAKGLNNKWFWTSVITPGEKNEIKINTDEKEQKNIFVQKNNINLEKNTDLIFLSNFKDIERYEKNTKVKIQGSVIVKPGIFGNQYFYIQASSSALQVYNSKKDFPKLEENDYIEVVGKISISKNKKRINISGKDAIRIFDNKNNQKKKITPLKLSLDSLGDNLDGILVEINGEIVERKGNTLYVDDGIGEIKIYIKKATQIKASNFKSGDLIQASGVFIFSEEISTIMPRRSEDIIKKDLESNENQKWDYPGVFLEEDLILEERDRKLELFKHLLIIAIFIIFILSYFLFRKF